MPRPSRAAQLRGMSTRSAEARRPPSTRSRGRLWIDPDRIPKGTSYRWIAETILGQPQDDRIASMMEDGWKPVPADRHPEWKPLQLPGRDPDTSGVIRRGGQVLVERPASEMRDIIREKRETVLQDLLAIQKGVGQGEMDDPLFPRFVDHNETSIVTTQRRGPGRPARKAETIEGFEE